MAQRMSVEQLLALPVSVDLTTAAQAFGMGRTWAYAAAKAGSFPCPVIPVGGRYRVNRADLLRVLGVTDTHSKAS